MFPVGEEKTMKYTWCDHWIQSTEYVQEDAKQDSISFLHELSPYHPLLSLFYDRGATHVSVHWKSPEWATIRYTWEIHTQHARIKENHQSHHWQKDLHVLDAKPQLKGGRNNINLWFSSQERSTCYNESDPIRHTDLMTVHSVWLLYVTALFSLHG